MTLPGPASTWPALKWEDQTWFPNTAWAGAGLDDYGARYLSAIPAMIAELSPDTSPTAASLADVASRELSRLDAELGGRVASFAPVLLRSEAASSSQIENITASARAREFLSESVNVSRSAGSFKGASS